MMKNPKFIWDLPVWIQASTLGLCRDLGFTWDLQNNDSVPPLYLSIISSVQNHKQFVLINLLTAVASYLPDRLQESH